MARPARPWFRFYVEAFGDRKMRRLSAANRWLWVAILGAARESPEPGILLVTTDLPMTHQELADYAGMALREVKRALPQMLELGLITLNGDTITVPNFTSRQFESDNVTARTRDFRERSKEQVRNVPKVVPGNVRGNTPETETETETEQEQADKPPTARKRAHQLPDDFAPNETNARIATERGVDLGAAVANFADHHRAKGTTYKDWHLALNTWLRRERPSVHPIRSTYRPPEARDVEQPPDGLSPAEYAAWEREARMRRAQA